MKPDWRKFGWFGGARRRLSGKATTALATRFIDVLSRYVKTQKGGLDRYTRTLFMSLGALELSPAFLTDVVDLL
jgi:hypothetical protein